MAGDFWLGRVEDFDEVADADLLIAHEVEEAETGVVAEGLEEAFEVEGCLLGWHGLNYIRLDEYVKREYICFSRYVSGGVYG